MLYILKNGILHTTLKLIIIQADLPKSGLPIQPVLPKLCLECLLQFVKVLQSTTGQNSSMEKKLSTSMEPPTTCVTDNNSANLAFMAIATKRAHLELQDEIFTLKFIENNLMETLEVAMARSTDCGHTMKA